MNTHLSILSKTILGACCLLLPGCTLKKAAEPLKPSAFIAHPEHLKSPDNIPFSLFWETEKISSWTFDKIIVEAVRTDLINADEWLYSAGSFVPTRKVYQQRLYELADYIQTALTEELQSQGKTKRKVEIINTFPVTFIPDQLALALAKQSTTKIPQLDSLNPGGRTMLLQVSISEAVFGDPLVYAGLLAVPVPALANLSTAVKAPTLVLEAKFVDQETGEIILEIVDRRFPQVKVVDLNRLFVSSALKELADSFNEDIAELFFRHTGEAISRRSPVSLFPW